MVAPIARAEHLVQRMALSGRVEDTLSGGTAVSVSAPGRSAIPSFPLSVHPIARRLERRRRALAETRLWAGTSRARRPRLFKTSGGCGDVLSVCTKPCLPEYSNRSGCKLEWRDGGHDGCSPAAMVAPIARTEHLVQRMALSGRVEDTAARVGWMVAGQ